MFSKNLVDDDVVDDDDDDDVNDVVDDDVDDDDEDGHHYFFAVNGELMNYNSACMFFGPPEIPRIPSDLKLTYPRLKIGRAPNGK